MDLWLVLLVIAIAMLSRPIMARLWRARRLTDRTLTLLLIGRFPVLVGIFALLGGASLPVFLIAISVSLLSGLFLYKFALGLIQEHSADKA